MHVLEVINFVQLLNSLKIKQSWFKMIYGHVSISKTNFVNPLYPLWAKKKYISFKYPKWGSSTIWSLEQGFDRRNSKIIYMSKLLIHRMSIIRNECSTSEIFEK